MPKSIVNYDSVIASLKIANRNHKLMGHFYSVLAKSQIFTLSRPGRRGFIIVDTADGENREYIACFSNAEIAYQTLQYYLNFPENTVKDAQIVRLSALKLFFSAATHGYSVCLNPKNQPDERLFVPLKRVKSFLVGPWALGAGLDASNRERPSALKRSRQGRIIVDDTTTQIPIADIDFEHYFTTFQLAGIFAVSENEINRIISELVNTDVIDLNAVSISLETDNHKPGSTAHPRYYDPLVTFLVGYQIPNHRGNEFRGFHAKLLAEYCLERNAASVENASLKSQILKLKKINKELEETALMQSKTIESHKTVPDGASMAIHRLHQEMFSANKEIALLKSDLAASSRWDMPESVMEAMQIAESRYGSRLIFHERVIQSIDDFCLKSDLRATHEAVKMFKALAEDLYRQKYVDGNFSEERFRNETGITLSMTESKASKRDKSIDASRVCTYKGSTVFFYPHLKANIQGIHVRLHFQFLEGEKKILICHFGHHLPNAKTKYMN